MDNLLSTAIQITINYIIKCKKQDIAWCLVYATLYGKRDEIFTHILIDKIWSTIYIKNRVNWGVEEVNKIAIGGRIFTVYFLFIL